MFDARTHDHQMLSVTGTSPLYHRATVTVSGRKS
jgi:hypothetical protein